MGKKKRNSFKEALNHIKSDKFNMIESIPTNNTANLMVVTPTTPNPDFVPEVISDLKPDFTVGANPTTAEEARDMSGFFFPDGSHKFGLPPITESSPDNSYILGPMSSMWYAWGNFSSIGYIRQSNRKMVDLGYITGKLSDWDGTSTGTNFYSQLTLEQAVWFRDNIKAPGQTNDPDTANFRAFYPGPPSNTPDEFNRYYATVSGVPKEEDTPAQGSPFIQGVNGPESAEDFFALLLKKLREAGDSFDKNVERGIEDLKNYLGNRFDDVVDGVIKNLGKITGYESATNMLNKYDDYLKKNPSGSNERIDVTSEFSSTDLNALNSVRNNESVKSAIASAIEINNNPEMQNQPVTPGLTSYYPNARTLGEVEWQRAADLVRDELQKKVYERRGLDNSIHNNVQIDIEDFINSGGQNWTIEKNYEFRSGGSVGEAEDTPLGQALTGLGVELDTVGTGNIVAAIGGIIAAKTGITGANQHGGLYNSPTMKYKVTVPKNKININQGGQGGRSLGDTTKRGGVQESISYERKKKILKDIKKPVIIEEKKYKQGKYRPKIIGSNSITKISKPVETPREFKEIGTRNSWGKFEKKRNRIESQEKMNSVYEILGGGNLAYNYMLTDSKRMNAEQMEKFWGLHPEMFSYYLNGKKYKVTRKEQVKGDYVVFLVDEKGEKSSILQSQLNEKVSEEKSKELFEKYYEQNPKSKPIPYDKDPLFKKVSNRLKPVIDYPNKPSKDGYPDKEPPKMINGFHPEIGKKYKYDKLDPHSAEMMPMQGDPEIDANIIKSRNKKEKERKEKILKLEDLTYHYFVKRAKESSKKVNQEKQKNREMAKTSLYKDKKEKGIKFYDKKGSGRIKAGKKVYD